MHRPPHRIFAALLLAAAVLPAQKDDAEKWREDPHTRGEREALDRAGYVNLGHFALGDNHNSMDVEHVLGEEVKILWIETAHFRLGCNLPEYKITEREERDKIGAEVRALRDILPRIPRRVRTLSPWLRAHLYAYRLEQQYQDFCERLGVTDADFPAEAPILGQPYKFPVLLFEKASSVGHYATTFMAMQPPDNAVRHYFDNTKALVLVTCTEFAGETLKIDTAMHCEVAFNNAHNMVDAYRGYRHRMPHWFGQGLAHWYLRRVSPKYNVFAEEVRFDARPKMLWDWPPRVRARVEHGVFPPAAELLRWRYEDEAKLVDSMFLWSRLDFLMSLGDERFRIFLHRMKGRIPAEGFMPTEEEVHKEQLLAMEEAWQLTPERFDEDWAAWVLQTYPRK